MAENQEQQFHYVNSGIIPPITLESLRAAIDKADEAERNRDRRVIIFPGTMTQFVEALRKADVKINPPEPEFPQRTLGWCGIPAWQVDFGDKPIVLCGDGRDVRAIVEDTVKLAAAIDHAYPERSVKARSFTEIPPLFIDAGD